MNTLSKDTSINDDVLPEYRLLEAYLQTLSFVVSCLDENAPLHLLTPSFKIALEAVKKAVWDLKVDYATQIRFTFK